MRRNIRRSPEEKQAIIKEANERGFKVIAAKYGIHHQQLYRWRADLRPVHPVSQADNKYDAIVQLVGSTFFWLLMETMNIGRLPKDKEFTQCLKQKNLTLPMNIYALTKLFSITRFREWYSHGIASKLDSPGVKRFAASILASLPKVEYQRNQLLFSLLTSRKMLEEVDFLVNGFSEKEIRLRVQDNSVISIPLQGLRAVITTRQHRIGRLGVLQSPAADCRE